MKNKKPAKGYYKEERFAKINDDAEIEFNTTDKNELHVVIKAFDKSVVLKESTFKAMLKVYKGFRNAQ